MTFIHSDDLYSFQVSYILKYFIHSVQEARMENVLFACGIGFFCTELIKRLEIFAIPIDLFFERSS